MKLFQQNNQETWNVGKIRNYDEERLLFREKCFHFYKSRLYKNGKAQNMPVLAGRLVQPLFTNGLIIRYLLCFHRMAK